jgi:lipopolysaccharide export system permease protein
MLFDSSVRKELGRSFGATLVVLLTIVLTMMLIRTLGQAASGSVSPQHVVLLMGYTVLGYLPTILALSLFVATVSTLSRMYRDSEMSVWFASGVPLGRFLKPVLRMGAAVLAVIAVLALFVWPWANQSIIELRALYERRSDLSRVAPGQFQSSSDGRRVFFIERNTDDGRVGRNVFVLTRGDERESVATASTGRIEFEGEDRYLVLDAGQQADHNAVTGERRIAQFDTYRLRIDERVRTQETVLPPRARSSVSLLLDPQPRHLGELTWRIGLPLTALNLLLLGVVLSATSPRRGTSWNLMTALLAFIVYYNLLNLSQAWVATGRLTPLAALLGIHGGTALLALALLRWRERGLAGWLPLPRSVQSRTSS